MKDHQNSDRRFHSSGTSRNEGLEREQESINLDRHICIVDRTWTNCDWGWIYAAYRHLCPSFDRDSS